MLPAFFTAFLTALLTPPVFRARTCLRPRLLCFFAIQLSFVPNATLGEPMEFLGRKPAKASACGCLQGAHHACRAQAPQTVIRNRRGSGCPGAGRDLRLRWLAQRKVQRRGPAVRLRSPLRRWG